MSKDLPDARIEHVWTPEDRESQLADLESICERLSGLFADNGDVRAAELFRAKAAHATRLLREGCTQPDLNELGGEFADGAWWLNPKAVDYSASRESWQDEVARLHEMARTLALDLRSVATLYARENP